MPDDNNSGWREEMRDLISKSRAFFTTYFGHCGTCMRQSLVAALAAWAVFGVCLAVWPQTQMQSLTGLAALALSAWWMGHVAAFAARARIEPHVELAGRRSALRLLARTAGAGVAASVPVLLWPAESFAFCGQCTKNADCGSGFVCKNTAAIGSGKICNECVSA
jgi:Cys-rich repeat protein